MLYIYALTSQYGLITCGMGKEGHAVFQADCGQQKAKVSNAGLASSQACCEAEHMTTRSGRRFDATALGCHVPTLDLAFSL